MHICVTKAGTAIAHRFENSGEASDAVLPKNLSIMPPLFLGSSFEIEKCRADTGRNNSGGRGLDLQNPSLLIGEGNASSLFILLQKCVAALCGIRRIFHT